MRTSLAKSRRDQFRVLQLSPFPGYIMFDVDVAMLNKAFDLAYAKRTQAVLADSVKEILDNKDNFEGYKLDIRECRRTE